MKPIEDSDPGRTDAELVLLARGGDAQARSDLIARIHGLLYRAAHAKLRESGPIAEADEIVSSEVVKALSRTIHLYDPALGHRWSTFAGSTAMQHARSFAGPYDDHAGPSTTFTDIGCEPGAGDEPGGLDLLIARERAERVRGLLDVLGPRRREIVSLYYGLGGGHPMTCRQIGDRLGVSPQAISQSVQVALKKLREAALERGVE